MKIYVDRKYLVLTRRRGPRPDGRRWCWRHNWRVSNFYVQVGPVEAVIWYR